MFLVSVNEIGFLAEVSCSRHRDILLNFFDYFGLTLRFFPDHLAYIPCPIIYGVLLDSACIMWGSNCGQRGNCWLYDSDYLRYVMQGLTLVVITCGTFLDGYVLYLCRSLSLFEDPSTEKNPKDIENIQSGDKIREMDNTNKGTNL